MSILVIISSLAALILIASQFFDTSSPVVTTTRELSRSAQSFNIFAKDLFPGITISHLNVFEPLKMNNFITIKAQIVQKSFNPAINNTEIDLSKKYNYIPCSSITDDKSLLQLAKKIAANVDLRISLCPNYKEVDNNVTIIYDPENLRSSYLALKFYPCSLPDKNDCYPITKIFGSEATMAELSNLVSPSSYENPVAFRWSLQRYLVDITRSKSFRYVLQQSKIIDDRYFFKKPEVKAEYSVFKKETTDSSVRDLTQLYCTSEMIEAGECEEYLECVYEMDNEVVVTTRRYKKFPALMGEFGGVLKVLTTIFVILSFYYSTVVNGYLFEKVFKVEKLGLAEADKITKKKEVDLLGSEKNSKTLKIHNKKGRKNWFLKDSQLKQFSQKVVYSKTDVITLIGMMNLVDILKMACLKNHHKILLPLVLLQLRQKSTKQPTPSWLANSEQRVRFQGQKNKNSKNLGDDAVLSERDQEYVSRSDVDQDHYNTRELASYREIYNVLKNFKPRNSIEGLFIRQVVRYLSSVFD